MFTGIKDSLTSSTVRALLVSRLGRYGKLTDLRIRSRERTITVELLLEGEEEPVLIQVDRYRIIRLDGEHSLVVESVTVSRAWLQNLLQDLLVDKPLPVPSMVLLALGKAED